MKIDNSFSERRIYRARSKAGMDRDLVIFNSIAEIPQTHSNCVIM